MSFIENDKLDIFYIKLEIKYNSNIFKNFFKYFKKTYIQRNH